jgi:hypothetical protein
MIYKKRKQNSFTRERKYLSTGNEITGVSCKEITKKNKNKEENSKGNTIELIKNLNNCDEYYPTK